MRIAAGQILLSEQLAEAAPWFGLSAEIDPNKTVRCLRIVEHRLHRRVRQVEGWPSPASALRGGCGANGLRSLPRRMSRFARFHIRYATITLFAAPNLLDGKVIGRCMQL